MKINFFKKAWLLVVLFLFIGVFDAGADVKLTDDLTLSGMARYTAIMSVGPANPDLKALNDSRGEGGSPRSNLLRTLIQMELNYRPTDIFRLYMKGRMIHDETYLFQGSDLENYNTTPWTDEHHGTDLMTGYGEDSFMAELWEVWANIETEHFWVRLGKQQIAWGDLPGIRIADKINPLDKSWHLTNEPEEYENIRIPEWAGRLYYSLPAAISGPFEEVFIDTFYNPGDIHPDIQPAPGSPYMNAYSGNPYAPGRAPGTIDPSGAPQPDPDYNDMRGKDEYGVRLGFNLAQFQACLMYMSLHNSFPLWSYLDAPVETQTIRGTVYPEIDVYAMTLSYAWDYPLNTSATFEGSYTPNQPWQDAVGAPFQAGPRTVYVPAVKDAGFWRTALYLERNVFWLNSLSRFFYPEKIGFMYYRHWLDHDESFDVKLTPAEYSNGNRLDFAMDMFYLSYTLPFGQGASLELNPKVYWNPEGSYKIQSFLKYAPNYSWRFDLGGMWQGGSSDKSFMYSAPSVKWNDELYFRITYSF